MNKRSIKCSNPKHLTEKGKRAKVVVFGNAATLKDLPRMAHCGCDLTDSSAE
jgi:hypothetical protein